MCQFMKRFAFALVGCALLGSMLLACIPREGREGNEGWEGEDIIVFTHVDVVPMTSETIVDDQTVLIQGERIVAVGSAGAIDFPKHATVIDGEGAYLMPGLADMHVHVMEESMYDWPVSPLNLYLRYGVTTIRNMGTTASVSKDETFILRWREQIQNGDLDGPTIYTTKRTIDGPVHDPHATVEEIYLEGFDFIKPYALLTPDDFRDVMAAADEYDLYAVGHIPWFVGLQQVLLAGMEEIAHVRELVYEFIDFDRGTIPQGDVWLSRLVYAVTERHSVDEGFDVQEFRLLKQDHLDEIIYGLQQHNVAVCTTLVVGAVFEQKVFDPQAYLLREGVEYLPERYLEAIRRGEDRHQVIFRGIENLVRWTNGFVHFILRELHRAGIRLVLGTDAGTDNLGVVAGVSVYEELQILTENGLTPYEALLTTTVNAARVVEAMTGEGEFGTVEEGKRADLILVGGNPLDDVSNIRSILGVMAAGRWYPRETLDDMIAIRE